MRRSRTCLEFIRLRRPYSHTYTHRCSDTHNTHYSLKRAVTTQHVPAASGAQIGLARRTSLTPHTEAQPAETQAGQHVTIRHATRGQTTPQRKRHRRHIDHTRTRRTTRGQTTPQRKRHRHHIDHARTRRTNTVKAVTRSCSTTLNIVQRRCTQVENGRSSSPRAIQKTYQVSILYRIARRTRWCRRRVVDPTRSDVKSP